LRVFLFLLDALRRRHSTFSASGLATPSKYAAQSRVFVFSPSFRYRILSFSARSFRRKMDRFLYVISMISL
jgi:hypothetical protein